MLGLETEAGPSLGTDRIRRGGKGWVQFGRDHQARISLPSCALWLKGARARLHQPSEGLLVAGQRPACTLNPPLTPPPQWRGLTQTSPCPVGAALVPLTRPLGPQAQQRG